MIYFTLSTQLPKHRTGVPLGRAPEEVQVLTAPRRLPVYAAVGGMYVLSYYLYLYEI